MTMTLSNDQAKALLDIKSFLFNDTQKEMILSGNSGSGKSTLVKYVISNLHIYLKPLALMKGEPVVMKPYLTATTNEAATVLSNASGSEARTVHSFFKFKFKKNYQTGELELDTRGGNVYTNALVVIDEASMLSKRMRKEVLKHTGTGTKILYVGDNEQLDAINSECDVFDSGLPEAHLTTNIRQAGNEIAALGLLFRDAVLSGKMPDLPHVDSEHIKYLTGEQFKDLIDEKYAVENYYPDRRILAYTNDRVIEYNKHIRQLQNGCSRYVEGEFLTTNNTITDGSEVVAKNNTDIKIQDITYGEMKGIKGHKVTACGENRAMKGIIPDNMKAAKAAINALAKKKSWNEMFDLQDKILDLRPRFASTVHKSQGGTLNEVYIDLNDIGSMWDIEKKARALYVGITRAKSKVYFYGSL